MEKEIFNSQRHSSEWHNVFVEKNRGEICYDKKFSLPENVNCMDSLQPYAVWRWSEEILSIGN